jgi:hypothetical protein
VKLLTETGQITEETQFESHSLTYTVKRVKSLDGMMATFANDKIVLHVSETQLENWYHNEVVGFENTQKLSNGNVLALLLEKDFACLDNRIEDQTDNYPNPKAIPKP